MQELDKGGQLERGQQASAADPQCVGPFRVVIEEVDQVSFCDRVVDLKPRRSRPTPSQLARSDSAHDLRCRVCPPRMR